MAPRPWVPWLALLLFVLPGARGAADAAAPALPHDARRVVSMNPSLTETLLALGAGERLVGVDEYSARLLPEVRELPTVGGLFNPSLERVVALEPDLLVVVPGARQRALRERVEALGIPVLELPNITLDQVLASIERLGERVGRAEAARARVREIQQTWARVERATAGRPRVRAVLVIQRDPLYVVGSGSWIDAMLRTAGTRNLGARFDEPYPRASLEWLLAAGPELILDATENGGDPAAHWSRWPSLPAVVAGRTLAIPRGQITRPGPYLDRALRQLAETIHGPDVLGP